MRRNLWWYAPHYYSPVLWFQIALAIPLFVAVMLAYVMALAFEWIERRWHGLW